MTILIPALNEAGNIGELVQRCQAEAARLGVRAEILIVDGGSTDGTVAEAQGAGATVLVQKAPGYGGALSEGLAAARGAFIITMDSDLSHEPEVIGDLWAARESAELIIASRYVPGGGAEMSAWRGVLSRILNVIFTAALRIPVRDISSGFRLYHAAPVRALRLKAVNFDVLEEILILLFNDGKRITEIPFQYRPRKYGRSHAKLIKFGIAYCRTFYAMWKLRRG